MVAYDFSPEYAQYQNNMTQHMLCPATGCPDKFEVGGGFYIPGNPWKARYEIELYKISLLIVIGCIFWEYGVTFYSEELQRWRDIIKGYIVPVNVLTLFARYFILAAAISAVFYVWDTHSVNCQAKLSILMTCLAVIWIATSLIYTLRVHAMYPKPNDRKSVRIPIVCVWILGSILWISSIPGFKAVPVSQAIRQPFSSGCSPAPSPGWRAMGFGAASVYDLIILILSINSVSRHSSDKFRPIYKTLRYGIADRNDTGGFIILSSMITFLISFPLNFLCFFVTIFSRNLILSNIPIALAALFDFMIANRLVFHSNQWSQGKSALLTMPTTYQIHKREGESNDYDRGDSFNVIAAAIAKRKVPNDPFDQFTIEQAIESHARMDAIAWRDYMQGPAPQDIRDAVSSIVLRERQHLKPTTTTTKNEKDANSITCTGDSSSEATSIRRNTSSRYKSRLEMELAQMENGVDIDDKKSKSPSIEQKEEIELPITLNQHYKSDIDTPLQDNDRVNEQYPSIVPEGWTVQTLTQEQASPQEMEEGVGLKRMLSEDPPFSFSNRSTTPQQKEDYSMNDRTGKSSFFDSVLKKSRGESSNRIKNQDRLPNENIRYQTDIIQVSDRED